jgi:hypothetical protein
MPPGRQVQPDRKDRPVLQGQQGGRGLPGRPDYKEAQDHEGQRNLWPTMRRTELSFGPCCYHGYGIVEYCPKNANTGGNQVSLGGGYAPFNAHGLTVTASYPNYLFGGWLMSHLAGW